jgi:fructose-bisphosphate aldolase class II
MAEDFAEKTQVDALAVSFGTAHGLYIKQPQLDFERIAAIRERIPTPLVMHGGSGIRDDDYRRAIQSGITKINYYTYMSKAGGEAAREYIGKNTPALFHEIADAARRAEKANVRHVMEVFRAPNGTCPDDVENDI